MKIPVNVNRVISLIRDSGAINMFDRRGVIQLAESYDPEVAIFLESNRSDYIKILEASLSKGEKWLSD